MPKVYNKNKDRVPSGAVYVGRGSPWGNKFKITFALPREQAIEKFRCEQLPDMDVTELIGKDLVCHCKPQACHADLLLDAAERLELKLKWDI